MIRASQETIYKRLNDKTVSETFETKIKNSFTSREFHISIWREPLDRPMERLTNGIILPTPTENAVQTLTNGITKGMKIHRITRRNWYSCWPGLPLWGESGPKHRPRAGQRWHATATPFMQLTNVRKMPLWKTFGFEFDGNPMQISKKRMTNSFP